MKLRSIICVSAAAAAVSASALTGNNTFARLPVAGAPASAIIALPFSGCGDATEGSIYVTNLVMTTNLENGDTLLHKNGNKWDAWEISGGKWVSIASSSQASGVTVSAPASEVAINCGEACWLNRNTPANTFYLYGQVNSTKKSVTIPAGNGTTPTYTIVGCPWEVGSFDVTTIAGADGDTILCMADNDAGKVEYRCDGGVWKTATTTTREVTVPKFLGGGTSTITDTVWSAAGAVNVPAGLGFMYGRKAASALTINWN